MPLVTTKEMFARAYAEKYAVGAFNVNNMEMIQAIVEAANEEKSPVILQVSAGARKYANPVYLKHLVQAAVETNDIPVAMHLDHGADFEICKASIDGGFTSVMIDASSHPWDENIAITKKVVEYAHDHGVVVEAELGKLAGIEDDVNVDAADAAFTSPDEVEEFVAKTGIDSLGHLGRNRQQTSQLPHRIARCFFRSSRQSCPCKQVWRSYARCYRYPRIGT